MYRLLALAAASFLVAVAIRSWPARTSVSTPIITVFEPPPIVVAPPVMVVAPPAPAPTPAAASFLATPPPRPSDRTIEIEQAKQCRHPDPRRTKASVLALAA